MYTLRKQFKFEASHQLPNHDGKCRRLHGHSWVGYLIVEGEELHTDLGNGPKAGMLIDYGDIAKVIQPLVDLYLDHHHLNETTGLVNPTSEHLARWIYDRIIHQLPQLVAVEIQETCTSSCVYRPGGRR